MTPIKAVQGFISDSAPLGNMTGKILGDVKSEAAKIAEQAKFVSSRAISEKPEIVIKTAHPYTRPDGAMETVKELGARLNTVG